MKPKYLFIYILAVLVVFPLTGTFAQSGITIDVIATFDYPGTGNQTLPQKINDSGEIVGVYIDSSGVSRGFIRSGKGSFSAPIVEPNDTGNFTEGRGINDARTVCGDYLGSDSAFHGFFLSDGIYTEFDVTDALDTEVLGINNFGDFAGTYIPSSTGIFQAFVSIGGSITPIDITGATFSGAYQLNASNRYCGYYTDGTDGLNHGFYLDNNGTLQFPVDPAGSTGTILFGLNNSEWIVGRYSDSAGVTHGLLLIAPNHFITFDYPGSTFTSLNGVNRAGFICGRYVDSSGIAHGIVARATRTFGNEAGREMKATSPALPVRATSPASSALPNKGPAL